MLIHSYVITQIIYLVYYETEFSIWNIYSLNYINFIKHNNYVLVFRKRYIPTVYVYYFFCIYEMEAKGY